MDLSEMSEIGRRAAQHTFEDGIGEMVFGFMFVLMGLLFLAEKLFRPGGEAASSIGPDAWKLAFLAVVAIGALLAQRVGRKLKERLVLPRAGLVISRQIPGRVKLIGIGLGIVLWFLIAFLLLVGKHLYPMGKAWNTLPISLVIGTFLLLAGVQQRLPRFLALGVLSLGAGIIVLFVHG